MTVKQKLLQLTGQALVIGRTLPNRDIKEDRPKGWCPPDTFARIDNNLLEIQKLLESEKALTDFYP